MTKFSSLVSVVDPVELTKYCAAVHPACVVSRMPGESRLVCIASDGYESLLKLLTDALLMTSAEADMWIREV